MRLNWKVLIVLVLLAICIGLGIYMYMSQKPNFSVPTPVFGDPEPIAEYINTDYGYRFAFPDEWIGKVGYIEFEKHTEFVYKLAPEDQALIYYIVAYTLEDWDEGRVENNLNSIKLLETKNHIITGNWGLDMELGVAYPPFQACAFDLLSDECTGLIRERYELIQAVQDNRHFVEVDLKSPPAWSSRKPLSTMSMNVILLYPRHGHEHKPVRLPYPPNDEEAKKHGDVVFADATHYNFDNLTNFIDNTKINKKDHIRHFESHKFSTLVREFVFDGNNIEYTFDYSDPQGSTIMKRSCKGIDYETTYHTTGEKLIKSTHVFLTNCIVGTDRYGDDVFHVDHYNGQYLSNIFKSDQVRLTLYFENPVYSYEEDDVLTLNMVYRGNSDIEIDYSVQLGLFTGDVMNRIAMMDEEEMSDGHIILTPGKKFTYDLPLKSFEKPLEKGVYWLVKHINVTNDLEEEPFTLAVRFEVQ